MTNVIIIWIMTLLYNLFILYKEGVPESLSKTSYIWESICGKPYLFTTYCILLVCLLFPVWMEYCNDNIQYLVFISCCGIIFAGCTPLYREDLQKPIHYASGIITMIAYVLWLVFTELYFLLIIEAILIVLLIALDYRNYVYYIEITGLMGLLIWLMNII